MDESNRPVIHATDLHEFFRREITQARDKLNIELSELTEYYIVNLLCGFSRADTGPVVGKEPLALIYKRSLEASLVERINILKDLGDASLFVAGFFDESIARSSVNIDYYISMGGNAYGSLSAIVGQTRDGANFADVYQRLSKQFPELVDVLTYVSDCARANQRDGSSDIIKLYDQWVRLGSHRAKRVLLKRGVTLDVISSSKYTQ